MAKHYVTMHITASYTIEVEADNPDEAQNKAWEKFDEADFGDAGDVDAEVFCVDDAHGNRVFEAD